MRILVDDDLTRVEVLSLYDSVGWSRYTARPDALMSGLAGSHVLLTVRADDGDLIALARTVSDGATVCYVPDLLVRPSRQREGVGRALLLELMNRYAHCPFFVLTTEHADVSTGATAHAFYRSMGLVTHEEQQMAAFALPLDRARPDA